MSAKATLDGALFGQGLRLAQGPWQQLPKGCWGIEAVGYMSLQRPQYGDTVVSGSDAQGWKVEKRERGGVEYDPVGCRR